MRNSCSSKFIVPRISSNSDIILAIKSTDTNTMSGRCKGNEAVDCKMGMAFGRYNTFHCAMRHPLDTSAKEQESYFSLVVVKYMKTGPNIHMLVSSCLLCSYLLLSWRDARTELALMMRFMTKQNGVACFSWD